MNQNNGEQCWRHWLLWIHIVTIFMFCLLICNKESAFRTKLDVFNDVKNKHNMPLNINIFNSFHFINNSNLRKLNYYFNIHIHAFFTLKIELFIIHCSCSYNPKEIHSFDLQPPIHSIIFSKPINRKKEEPIKCINMPPQIE